MAQKVYSPVTPARRYLSTNDFSTLTPRKKQPSKPKKLFVSLMKHGGRNNHGHITTRHQGGGHRRKFRLVDLYRNKLEVPATIRSIEYDPGRTAFIALAVYADGEKRYILAPQGLQVGDPVVASETADIKPGNHMSFASIPVGTLIHNVELEPGRGGKVALSAGSYAQLMAKDGTYCHVKMPSGELRLLHIRCRASIGQLSNSDHENVTIGKAGRQRWLGIRPTVRGVAMNPVDHPMGGGEGKASGGHPRSPWGQYAKGYKTRTNKRTARFIVKRRK